MTESRWRRIGCDRMTTDGSRRPAVVRGTLQGRSVFSHHLDRRSAIGRALSESSRTFYADSAGPVAVAKVGQSVVTFFFEFGFALHTVLRFSPIGWTASWYNHISMVQMELIARYRGVGYGQLLNEWLVTGYWFLSWPTMYIIHILYLTNTITAIWFKDAWARPDTVRCEPGLKVQHIVLVIR